MPEQRRTASVIVELVRLAIVLLLTAAGYRLGPTLAELFTAGDRDGTVLISSVMGALIGYVAGGVAGRTFLAGVDTAEASLRRVEAAVLIAAVLAAALGGVFGFVLLFPVLLLPGKGYTVPIATLVLIGLVYAGARLGAARGGDLLRFVGARGRFEVTTPSRGGGVKLVDTSALIDGRIVATARAGFLDGTLVVPQFVLNELQGLADTEDPRRRSAGQRGLEALKAVRDDGTVAVEVTDQDVPTVADVDAKLVALCRELQGSLLTVDSNLARVAEVSGVRVLNLHALADAMRPPVLPGERLELTVSKEGREQRQGVGYLPDGTMVVIERAADKVGQRVSVEVTSMLQTRNGRMVFAALAGEHE
ncbi:MAG: TRAM domain-containing protein [Actinobacteria bacterium]|nr:TRAM domain-containing protein [Actinomycetota bacterium]